MRDSVRQPPNPPLRRAIALAVALALVQVTAAEAWSICAWNLGAEKTWRKETAASFADRKKRLAATGLAAAEPKDPFDVLAMMEIAADRDGFDVLRLGEIVEKGSPAEKKRIYDLGKRLKAGRAWTRLEIRETFADLYFVANPPLKKWSLPGFLRRRLPQSADSLILRRFELELGTKAIEDSFRDAGLIRDPKLYGAFKLWKANHPVLFSSLNNIAWNAFWIQFAGIPVVVPKGEFLKLRKITDELAAKYKIHHPSQLRELPPEVYAEIKSKFGLLGNLDAGLKAASFVTAGGALTLFLWFYFDPVTRDQWGAVNKVVRASGLTERELKEYQEKNFDCAATRKRLWDAYREGFHDLNDRYPDPKAHPEDSSGYETNRARIEDCDCDALKVHYEE